MRRRYLLQRLFSTFPGGWPGVGVLLLRAAAGIVLITQGISYLIEAGTLASSIWPVALVVIVSGVLLLIGFLTPLGSVLATLYSAGIVVSLISVDPLNLLHNKVAAALVGVMAAALGLLGPGASSVDSRLFGRREIVIPQVSRPRNLH